jgi:hypothetical protein
MSAATPPLYLWTTAYLCVDNSARLWTTAGRVSARGKAGLAVRRYTFLQTCDIIDLFGAGRREDATSANCAPGFFIQGGGFNGR